jgi:hypothetical protein
VTKIFLFHYKKGHIAALKVPSYLSPTHISIANNQASELPTMVSPIRPQIKKNKRLHNRQEKLTILG